MKKILLTEEQMMGLVSHLINENVFVSGINRGAKKATLSYNKGETLSRGNKKASDMIKTDKMDAENDDTYVVKLKGNVDSYNITSIRGSEVMHYFKRYFNKEKTNIKIGNDEYELLMSDPDFKNFIGQFIHKVWRVVNFWIRKNKNKIKDFSFDKLSIYPVPSSTNFNLEMAKIMSQFKFLPYPTYVVDQNILKKDVNKMERDAVFINKNKDYFNGPLYDTDKHSIIQHVDSTISKYKSVDILNNYIKILNDKVASIIGNYYLYNAMFKKAETLKFT